MNSRKWITVIACIILVVTFSVNCGGGSAEDDGMAVMVLTNGVIYTVEGSNWENEAAEAVAIDADGMILFVGSADDAEEYIGDNTEVIDLDGNVVFPGFIDSHCHTPGYAITDMYEIYLYEDEVGSLVDALEVIAEFIEENPDFDVYWGSGYTVSIGADARGPKAADLDEICDDKPIILFSSDGHNIWMNSIAFEMNGITPDTPVPPGGSVPVDPATGKLWGSITDAPQLLTMEQEEYTEEEQLEAFAYFQEMMHEWGYTSIMAIAPHDVDSNVFMAFEKAGDLALRINIAGLMEPEDDIDEAIEETLAWQNALKNSELMKVSTMKYFADGVVEGMTAYLSEPYAPAAGLAPDARAEFYWNLEELKEYFVKTLAAGLQIHVHSIGDAATEETLNALEYAHGQHQGADPRSVLTHLQLVKDADKARMGQLNIIGSTQPFWHFKEPDWFEYVDEPVLGTERVWTQYPVKSLEDAGVRLTFSGDHPVTPDNSPFWAIETSVTRNIYNEEYYDLRKKITDMDDPTWLLNPAERISVKTAIEAYTINGAYQLFREDEVGSIKVGKYADLIVVDLNIFELDPIEIDTIEVLATIFSGEVVFGEL